MAKKIWYSSPLKFFWQELYGTQKKFTPGISDEHIFNLLRNNLLKAPFTEGENIESRELIISGLELWREDSKGNFLHIFFLEQQLRDFLEMTPLSDLDGLRKYLYEHGTNRNIEYILTKTISKCVVFSFGLHIPYEKNGYAFILSLEENNTIELYFCHGKNSGRMSDKFYADLKNKQDDKSETVSKMFRLAINTIAYMKCFPECVTEGVPKISYDNDEGRSARNVTFQMSEKIVDSDQSHNRKIPHFRKGFFRALHSDYYTYKKGQIVYVTETMVKGKAKTVSTSTQIDEFEGKIKKESNK